MRWPANGEYERTKRLTSKRWSENAVDNVPGVPLIGPKTAGQLLARYGTLDNVLAHADEVPGDKTARESEARS